LLRIDIAQRCISMGERNKSSMNNVRSREKYYWEEFNNSVETQVRKRRNLADEEINVKGAQILL